MEHFKFLKYLYIILIFINIIQGGIRIYEDDNINAFVNVIFGFFALYKFRSITR